MTQKHWLILGAGVAVGGVGTLILIALACYFLLGHTEAPGAAAGLPVYATAQSASSHAGYMHNSLTCGSEVYVNDYEEACLQLANPEPAKSIGFIGCVGNAGVCAIPGQPATAYIAGDCGSEMPAYIPYRNIKQPPFDWRTCTFREMSFLPPGDRSNWRQTTNTALIGEVIQVLRDGTPVALPGFEFTVITMNTNPTSVRLTSDQLPGLQFCPPVYCDGSGTVYVAESLMLDTAGSPTKLHAHWIPAGPMLARWVKGP